MGRHLIQLRCLVGFLQSYAKCPCCSTRCYATDCPLLPPTSSIRHLVILTCADLFTPRSTHIINDRRQRAQIMFLDCCMCMAPSTCFNISATGCIGINPWRATDMLLATLLCSWLKRAAADEQLYILRWAPALFSSIRLLSVFW